MLPRIAIPLPHFSDAEYAERAIPQYERAVALVGGEPVRVSLEKTATQVHRTMEHCDGILLPGSKADIDPARFHAARSAHTAMSDSRRDAVDDLLLKNAYEFRKPVLGICYGLQSLNVCRGGSLVQHIPDFLPEETRNRINHEVGKKAVIAHSVEIEPESMLAEIVAAEVGSPRAFPGHVEGSEVRGPRSEAQHPLIVPVNSSHHQSAEAIGKGLRIVARCPDDGIIEALEGTAPDHFVLAVQWHPERSVQEDAPSLAIFRALIEAARQRRQTLGAKAAQ
jgi:putative glutamine amidotransferase